jgi:hypothetical protein
MSLLRNDANSRKMLMSIKTYNLKKVLLAAVALLSFASVQTIAVAAFTDTFDTIDPAWVTDRYEPEAFVVENFLGDNRLRIDIDISDSAANRPGSFSSAFYNTQGRQRPAGVTAPWVLSGDLYVDSAFNTTTGQLARTDLWGRDSNPVEALAHYPVFGITNASPTDGFNPSAPDRSFRFRVWDANTANGWVDLAAPVGFAFDQFHNLSIAYDGTSFEYKLDGATLYTDATASLTLVGGLQTAFVEAYNFGVGSYTVRWDNISVASIPEPASMLLLGMSTLGSLLVRPRRNA